MQTAESALQQLLVTHEERLKELLGFWPVNVWKIDEISPAFTKYTLCEMPDGRWAMLHHFTQPDEGEGAHSHPCSFDSHGIVGGYIERVYQAFEGGYAHKDVVRPPGGMHSITPDCIHRLIRLLGNEAWTLCFAGPVVNEWRHYSKEELVSPSQQHSKYHTASFDTPYSG